MCGIVGILLAPHAADPHRLSAIESMASTLRHRGPDGSGVWFDAVAGIALGHRRLAILDLSKSGHQPMVSHGGNLVMTFNGEVYNHAGLRADLEMRGERFRGSSDTEVMLSVFESFGVEPALKLFGGMFALGLWDRERRVLHLARDRIGKKPLYVAFTPGALLFASELRALGAFPGFVPRVEPAAIAKLLQFGFVPDDLCVWKNVFKLPPGTVLSVRADALTDYEDLRARVSPWWSLAEVVEDGQRNPIRLEADELEDELDNILRASVRERMVADVPLGAFLSGGIDSTSVVALMQAQSPRPIRTFTIGFAESGYDEAAHAARIARHFGTEHTEFRLTPAEALAVIPDLPHVWDEPFADESQIPTLLLARLARQHVTVALSGDGGDECFGGYPRYFFASGAVPLFMLPAAPRRLVASLLMRLSPERWRRLVDALPLPRRISARLGGDNQQKLAAVLVAEDEDDLYEGMMTVGDSTTGRAGAPGGPNLPDLVSGLMYRDMRVYLPGDILVKLDRASMATSLEARCPLLDHRVVEFAWRLPTAFKVRGGEGKWLLRRVLARYLPKPLLERPKQGFNVPIGAWLAGPLRDWAEDLLGRTQFSAEGLLDCDRAQRCWQDHLSGRRDRSRELWTILMVQAWLEARREVVPSPTAPLLHVASRRRSGPADAPRLVAPSAPTNHPTIARG